jgi:hypothetical protein
VRRPPQRPPGAEHGTKRQSKACDFARNASGRPGHAIRRGSPACRRRVVGLHRGAPKDARHRSVRSTDGYWDSTRESPGRTRCALARAVAPAPPARPARGLRPDTPAQTASAELNIKIYSTGRSVNEPLGPSGRLTIEPHGFWAVFTVNHRRMSCVKVSSRLSLRW